MRALIDLFPDVSLDASKLQQSAGMSPLMTSPFYPSLLSLHNILYILIGAIGAFISQNVARRRKFFEDYARSHSFDYTNPYNWYLEPYERILATKVFPFPLFLPL